MKRSFLIVLILLSAPLFLSAQSVWEGSCAVGGYGSFPSTGLYGASNSFPQNTLVTVENAQTNQKATVLIIDRLNDSGLFLLLSKDAGSAIGVESGQVSQVRVTLAKQSSAISKGPGDLPYSTDPDVFPAAGVGNPTSLSFLDQYLKGGSAPQSTQGSQPASAAQPSASSASTTQQQPTSSGQPTSTAQTNVSPPTPPAKSETASQPPASTAPVATEQPESGPNVSALAPQPEQRLTSSAPATPPPAPELAQESPSTSSASTTASNMNPPQPANPSSSLPSTQGAEAAPGPSTQEVPSATGVEQGTASAQATQNAQTTSVPEVQAPESSGPHISDLKSSATPQQSLPSTMVLQEPSIPDKVGGAPIVTQLEPVPTPKAPTEIAMAGPPALPSIRNPGPMTTGIAAASPPITANKIVALDVPQAPGGSPAGPQVTELAQASPVNPAFSATVSALPAIPSQPQTAEGQTSGPLVSALAQAEPPTAVFQLAQSELPLPEIAGLTPDVTRLASEAPATGEKPPVEVSEVPALRSPGTTEVPQTTGIGAASAPAITQAQTTTPSTTSSAPSNVGGAVQPGPTPHTAGTASEPPSTTVPSIAKTGRIPVRPSTALAAASYYLQLGVYGESSAALALADNLSPDYPVSVYAFKKDEKSLYKVMIGPLNSDESGTLLYLFTAQGYRDAFVRKGD